jgi:ribosomal protein S18 acetylase RimI-like enzyme
MKIEVKNNNRIYFSDKDIAFANITIDGDRVNLELLKVTQSYRQMGFAKELMHKIMQYIRYALFKIRHITLNPLPLDNSGLTLEELIIFYQKFGFERSYVNHRESPYHMIARI